MNVLSPAKKMFALSCLLEGNSIRSTERLTGVHEDQTFDQAPLPPSALLEAEAYHIYRIRKGIRTLHRNVIIIGR